MNLTICEHVENTSPYGNKNFPWQEYVMRTYYLLETVLENRDVGVN